MNVTVTRSIFIQLNLLRCVTVNLRLHYVSLLLELHFDYIHFVCTIISTSYINQLTFIFGAINGNY